SNITKYSVWKSNDGVNFHKVYSRSAGSQTNSYHWIDNNPYEGNNFYRVNSADANEKMEYSRIVTQHVNNAISQISLYTNPVTGGKIGLEFKNSPVGKYSIKLINSRGQVVSNKMILHRTRNSIETVKPEQHLVGGIYHLEITSPANTICTLRMIVL
ncbi:MAG: T9SS type A sorting domain-containing protein, partial [Ferruginibacter sp.]